VVFENTQVNPAARTPRAPDGGHMLQGFKMRTNLNACRIFLFGFYNAPVSNEIVACGACRCPLAPHAVSRRCKP
jgi:hypothetical protein